ncbi:MAG: hypothetical protein DWQ47_00035 [Acidobacteria bacterium]|nr:MAG: hypothetical protein DWQ32_10495 [Acidobacteriota bacterium]REK03903.1 MAG: hypothetical protein DWQ38_00020 [Acidobacteriota bacterium]REK15065.1 MAG: hypothetical protein DWQ43_16185 [Acidobacteriota bacterium]REK46155.1 MAG: hypothetical protein DWQ47_00035 [Acidobacteriota bacterium]
MTKSNTKRILSVAFAAVGFLLLSGSANEVSAQCSGDPFCKPAYERRVDSPGSSTSSEPKGPIVVAAPSIESRIEYYKEMREKAAMNGQPIPKVTSVLLLDEMSVTGIFKTPRGYGAMVEATPIKLSYTIYPGEKFFDGQLVAVEENRLVFRKVTKWSNNKFVSSVENKALREYSMEQEIQGTAPSDEYVPSARTAKSGSSDAIVSPLEEMNNSSDEDAAKTSKKSKRPTSNKKKGS